MRKRPGTEEPAASRLRIYLRRSKADEGHQQFSLDVQREGCRTFVNDILPQRFNVQPVWSQRVEYVDDDRAGDDFLGRVELCRLREEARQGDIIICRDQSRLGRDALEVTLAVRELVQASGARLFFYVDAQEVPYAKAIDAAMTFVRGVGHQMELEAIRSRVTEALRSRVRAGRIAGGRCFGYALKRETDGSGRGYTTAVVDPEQAAIVRRIFREYRDGRGIKSIAINLNNDRIPSPRKASGSWSPGAIREMLRNARYRGLYVHGRIKRVRRGGKYLATPAPVEEIISVDVPEWRIVDDEMWFAVQDLCASRGAPYQGPKRPGPANRYALTGIARCAKCGGSIGAQYKRRGDGTSDKAYGCDWHSRRGDAVCDVKHRQSMAQVDRALADHLIENLLTEATAAEIIGQVRTELERQLAASKQDVSILDAELAQLRAEQRNLATAVATGGSTIPELVTELRRRNERIRLLEMDVAAAKRTPKMVAEMLAKAEAGVREKLRNLRATLGAPGNLREVFLEMFPEGLQFHEERVGKSATWKISGSAEISKFTLSGEPGGI